MQYVQYNRTEGKEEEELFWRPMNEASLPRLNSTAAAALSPIQRRSMNVLQYSSQIIVGGRGRTTDRQRVVSQRRAVAAVSL